MTKLKGRCEYCRRSFKIKDDGTLRWHRKGGSTCLGAGKNPVRVYEVTNEQD